MIFCNYVIKYMQDYQYMQDHQNESKRGHQEIQPRDHTINDHGIKEPDESPKNAEARPRQTDHTPGQVW